MRLGEEVEEGLHEIEGVEGPPRIMTHGVKGVAHLREKPVGDVFQFLDWVHKISEDSFGRLQTHVSSFSAGMAEYHKYGAHDQSDMKRMLRAVPGQKFIPKGYFPPEVWAGIKHFNPNVLRDGTLDDILIRFPGYKDPSYSPTPRRFRRCRPSVTRVQRPRLDSAS